MDAERWQRIKDAFSAALEIPPEERAEWLSFTLPYDPSLADEVKKLLAAYEAADDFYERGALDALPEAKRQLEGSAEGMRVGPYRLLSELGHGGMGAVYLAARDDPSFTQKVALKLIKRGMDTDEIVRRFVAERQILASLAHPNIARLFDGGSTPDGRPYFVMEYVEGRPITVYAAERRLSIEDRLHLFLRVCRAVQHAHQSLVVHRDLKPANILVDAEGEPKLLDFGIAKLLDPHSFGGMTALTDLSPGPMTPDYASPEQRTGGPVTTATDVYGLGLLLYELLVGETPRGVERKLGDVWAGRPPSQAVVALRPGEPDARRLARRMSGDLDTIVGKTLEHEPERRYGTAASLADDVERHLTKRPVAARRPTVGYRLSRALVRYKLAAVLGLAVCLLAVFSSYEAWTASRALDRAKRERQIAQALNDFQLRIIERASPEKNRGETLTIRQVLDEESQELLGGGSRYPPETRAALLEAVGNTYRKLGLYQQAQKNLRAALQLREQGRDSSDEAALALAENLSDLGQVSLERENYLEAGKLFQRALALKEPRLGKTALSLTVDLSGLGIVCLEKGDLDCAGREFRRACAISYRHVKTGPKELAECNNNLGTLAQQQEDYARARIFLSRALQGFQAVLGEDHLDTVTVRGNLAAILGAAGDYAGAEVLSQKVVEEYRRLLKPNHPDLARALLQLATLQREGNHPLRAQTTLDELFRMRRDYGFPRDQEEADAWNVQGLLALDLKRLESADEAFGKSYEIYRGLPGDHRAKLSSVLNSRARVRLLRDDPSSALDWARLSLKLAQISTARSGDAVPQAELVLGKCYLAMGQREQARPLLESSHKAFSKIYGPAHHLTLDAADHLHRLDSPSG